jgi:hypothetical protein
MRLPTVSVAALTSMVAEVLTTLQDKEEKGDCSVAMVDALYAEGKKVREPE